MKAGAAPPLKGRIVIIDDEQEMRSLLEDSLAADGYEVIAYSSAVRTSPRDSGDLDYCFWRY